MNLNINRNIVKFAIVILIIIILIIVIKSIFNNRAKEIDNNTSIIVEKNNDTDTYTIYNKDRTIISNNVEESMIKLYEDNPEYDPIF